MAAAATSNGTAHATPNGSSVMTLPTDGTAITVLDPWLEPFKAGIKSRCAS